MRDYTISIGTQTATGTITDNDEVVVADITDATEQEGDDLIFAVTMSGESAMDETYAFDITDVTATLGTDYDGTPVFTNGVTYDPVAMTITVPAGVTDFEVTFPGLEDAIDEQDETFTITIGGETATGTIIDNDEVTVVAIADVTANEGDDLVFTVDMSGVSDMDQVYPFDITDITATQGDDYDGTPIFSDGVTYDPVTMTITIPAGVEDFTVTFPGVDDLLAEDNETFTVTIDGVTATGTIIDDEGVIILNITDETELEGTDLVHTVTLNVASAMDETFPFSITDNTTDQAADYTFPPTFSDGVAYDQVMMTVTVPAGVTSFTVTTPTTDDLLDEEDESYTISIGTQTATGTITDNDEVVVADITDATEQEGDDLIFAVTMSGESAMDETYAFDITDLTATLGTDYDGTPLFTNGVTYDPVAMTITVPAGVTDFEVTFPGLEDAIDEQDETFTITIGGETATGTIIDNDEVTVVAIADVTANEGDDLVFTVDMSGVSDMDQVYPFDITDITATQGDDYDGTPIFSDGVTYDPVTMTITIPAGVEDFTVTFPGVDDLLAEDNETFTVTIDGVTATGTIIDDEGVIILNITDETELEGTDLVHTVTLNVASAMDETFPFSITDNTTDQAADYTFPPTFSDGVAYDQVMMTVTVPAGVTSFTVTTPTTDDLLDEEDESYTISIGTQTATGTITDNDEVVVADITDATEQEGDDLIFAVTMSGESAMDETYAFDITDVTATLGTDYDGTPVFTNGVTYDPVTMTITVPAGVTDFEVTFPGLEDAIDEQDETFTITIGGETATGTIIDNDEVTVVAIADVTANEGDDLVFTVDMSGVSDMDQVYPFDITDITATQGDDYDGTPIFSDGVTYDPVTMTITIPAGVEDFTVTFPGIDDLLAEDNETFTVTIDGVTATGTIIDDEGVIILNITDETELEGTDLVHTVTLNVASAMDETFPFSITDNTTDQATDYTFPPTFSNGVTYDPVTMTVTVPAGVTSFTVTTPTTDDLLDEQDEDYTITIGTQTATGTITDNDEVVVADITDATEQEGDALTFGVTMSGESAMDETYAFDITDVTATLGTDYDGTPLFTNGVTYDPVTMTITVPAGVTDFEVTFPGLEDAIDEQDETFTITIGGETATGTIIDNDDPAMDAEITGHIYEDINGNGIQDAGENDLAGVLVMITDSNGDTQTVVTDSNGDYNAQVPSGTTIVDIDETTLPSGSVQTEGTDPTTITVIAGGINFEENNGYNVPTDGAIAGVVYDDVNGNGIQDAGEPGIEGVTVVITDASGTIQTVVTDVDGNYMATVVAGDTVVDIDEATLPIGAVQTEGTDPTTVTVLVSETTFEENNGFNTPSNGTITGVVYDDINGNGIQDAGEPGLQGISVIVTDVNGTIQTVITDMNGNYIVSVPAGDTSIDVDDATLPIGANQTEGTDPTTVTAIAGNNVIEENNGYNTPSNGTIEGHIYNDLNGNGTQDAGEPDLAGVEVLITDANGNVQTVTTNVNGDYSVSIVAGDAIVDIDETTLPVGAVQTEGTDPTVVNVVVGNTVFEENNGYQEPNQAGTIEGHVYNDLNGNGTQDVGEPDLAGVSVVITDTDGTVQTVVTDANGDYSATVAGNQNATVDIDETTLPVGAIQTEGTDPTTVTVPEGGIVFEENNGYALPSSPNLDLVKVASPLIDTNGDGVIGAGDTITYVFTVTNNGNVAITNITITDPLLVVNGGPIDLAVGATDSTTFSGVYSITQEDVDAGGVVNIATATGQDPSGNDVIDVSDDPNDPTNTDTDGDGDFEDPTVTIITQVERLDLIKIGEYVDFNVNGVTDAGDRIRYTFTVTNTGNVTIFNVIVTDPLVDVIGDAITLLPGESAEFTAFYTITQADIDNGSVTNSALATGTNSSGDEVIDISDDPTDPTDITVDGDVQDPTVTELIVFDNELVISNGISIGEDSINDRFRIDGIENFPDNTLRIFNRWGVEVYSAEGYGINGKTFKGLSEGRSTISQDDFLPVGTYYWVLEYRNAEGTQFNDSGYLYIHR